MRLDYSSLSEPVTDDVIASYASQTVSSKDKLRTDRRSFITVAVGLYLFLSVPVVIGSLSSGKGISASVLIVMIAMAVVMIGAMAAAMWGSKLQLERLARMKRFAEGNNATYSQDVFAPVMAGMIFDEGHSRMLNDSLAFANGFEVGNYTYVTGTGKNSVSHAYTFVRVSLKRNLPHMVLDAKSNNFFGSNLPDRFSDSQRLSLEGDFDKYFDVYVPQGYAKDALYVFTPDVMQVLVDRGSEHDIEVVGDELYIFRSGKLDLTSKEQLEDTLAIAEAISDELKDQSKRYVDERAKVENPMGGIAGNGRIPEVAKNGRRLKEEIPVMTLVYIGFLAVTVFLPPFLPQEASDIYLSIAWPILFVWLIGFGIREFIKSKR